MPAIICPHCGVTNRAFSNFCNNCGADLRDEAISPEERTFDPHGDPAADDQAYEEIAPRLRQDRNRRESSTDASRDESNAQGSPGRSRQQSDYHETFVDHDEQRDPSAQQSVDDEESDTDHTDEAIDNLSPSEAPDVDELSSNRDAENIDVEEPTDDLPSTPTRDPLAQDDTQTAEHIISDRLVSGVSGALRPHDLVHTLFADDLQVGQENTSDVNIGSFGLGTTVRRPVPTLDSVTEEDIRATMSMGALLENELLPVGPPRSESLRIPAIFWLLIGVLLLVLSLNFTQPGGTVQSLGGVGEALTTIESLPQNANVLVLWGYDPATAGEMDLVVQPVLQHLIDKEAQLAVVSSLPMGPATLRRLWLETTDQFTNINRSGLIDLGYLPGGAASMPLMAYTDVLGILRYGVREFGAGSTLVNFWQRPPDLMLIVAAQAEDIQLWLEQVQPLNDIPAVAVTAAAVDPVARPYWNSGQLAGLVSGFDGAITYQNRIVQQLTLAEQSDQLFLMTTVDIQTRHLIAQNWGHLVLLLLILLGNLSFLAKRRQPS